jgi:enoyl-CoA hydratase/carnithine racemase
MSNTEKPSDNQESLVIIEDIETGIKAITLNRPDQFNALCDTLLSSLQSIFDRLVDDSETKVVILKGAGRAFCAGHDLKEMRDNPNLDYQRDLFKRCSNLMLSITQLPQPIIAQVQGIATAAGCQLVATCDLAVASTKARFAVSGVNLGLFCSTPGVALARNLPRKRALEMLMTGDFIDAPTAERWNLINRAVEEEELDETVMALARKIASKPKSTLSYGKKAFYQQIDQTLMTAYERAGEVMACNMMDPEAIEGIDAFIEKRDPEWKSTIK